MNQGHRMRALLLLTVAVLTESGTIHNARASLTEGAGTIELNGVIRKSPRQENPLRFELATYRGVEPSNQCPESICLLKANLENVPQTRLSQRKGLLSLTGAVCLVLAFMVFAWGTNYKLSLYKAGHKSSPAKVCTRGSDNAKNALDHATDGRTVVQIPLSAAILFSLLQVTDACLNDWQRDEAVGDLSPLSCAPILRLRPPPDELRLPA